MPIIPAIHVANVGELQFQTPILKKISNNNNKTTTVETSNVGENKKGTRSKRGKVRR
jgi:hypothetical protein